MTNPILIEVTSNSTEEYDRIVKLQHYQTIPTVKEIVIVSHREPRIWLHRRTASEWMAYTAAAGESLPLESIAGILRVDEIYRDGLEDAAR